MVGSRRVHGAGSARTEGTRRADGVVTDGAAVGAGVSARLCGVNLAFSSMTTRSSFRKTRWFPPSVSSVGLEWTTYRKITASQGPGARGRGQFDIRRQHWRAYSRRNGSAALEPMVTI